MTDTTTPTLCDDPGCQSVAVFHDRDDDGNNRHRCFVHDAGDTADQVTIDVPPAGDGFSEDVVAGLAAMILDHTAMTLLPTETAVQDAMASLAEAAGMPSDFAAGILLATTWIVAAGQVDDGQLTQGAEMFEGQAAGEPIPFQVDTGPAQADPCELCDSAEHTTQNHDQAWPLPGNVDDTEEGSDHDHQD